MEKIVPHIWFEDQAREAAAWYTSIFKNSQVIADVTIPDTPSGDANLIMLTLLGHGFQFLSAGPLFDRNPSFSYMVSCPTRQDQGRGAIRP